MEYPKQIKNSTESTVNQIENREFSESEKLAKAETYWQSRLTGEQRLEHSQSEKCQIAIVVPVYNEQVKRLERQLNSLRSQSIDKDKFEIIYVVNNGLSAPALILEQNSEAIEALSRVTDLPVFVIDKSSAGNEIDECNVGRARNRGVAEASRRFHESGKNGIIVQTDADTYFEDPDFLAKILSTLEDQPDTIGIAGGLIFEFDPDTIDEDERALLEKKVEHALLLRQWGLLKSFLKNKYGYSALNDNTFSGANMISRSFESAVVGGLIDANKGEDPKFGHDLEDYAQHNHGQVIGRKNTLKLVTAIRESDRTLASFRALFDSIDLDKPVLVEDPLAPSHKEFKKTLFGLLSKVPVNEAEIVKFVTSPSGELFLPTVALEEIIKHIQTKGFRRDDPFLVEWSRQFNLVDENFVAFLHRKKYPSVVLTQKVIDHYRDLVLGKEGGQKVVENLAKVVAEIRIRKQ